MRKLVFLLLTTFSISTAIAQLTDSDVSFAKQLVTKNAAAIGVSTADISNSIVSSTYSTKENIRMVYLQQSYLGLPVYNQLHVLAFRNEKAVSISGSRLQKIGSVANSATGVPVLTAEQAVIAGLSDAGIVANQVPAAKEIVNANGTRRLDFGNMGLTYENITAELIWMPVEENTKVKLAWQVLVAPNGKDDCWLITIDALNGSIIGKRNMTVYDGWDHKDVRTNATTFNYVDQRIIEKKDFEYKAPIVNGASYLVIKYPAESPQHTGGTATLHSDPWTWAPGNATSLKWHSNGTTDYTITRGNNVWATEDRAAANANTGLAATSSTNPDPLTFNFPPDYTVAPTTAAFQQFAITNLFYWNNLVHDIMYVYGFDEAGHNFQVNNQGRGGVGNDDVAALAQSGAGTNNANFLTLADGQRGRMRMYLFTSPNPDRDGDLDNGIVSHEYGHGISNRLTGGGSAACLGQTENEGEGWSDYIALMLTTDWSTATINDGFNIPRPMGTYVLNQNPTTGSGIRLYRYCTNIAVNPLTYANMGVSPVGTEVHNIGEIWCMALWEMTWQIIQTAGINPNLFNPGAGGGNAIAFKLVTEGMRLQVCNPGFIDARDAILKADTLFYGAQFSCAIWTAFAKRGMGRGASQGSPNSATDQTASFIVSSAGNKLNENVQSQQEGQNVTYTTKVNADNCGAISNYFVTDTLPTNVTYISGGSYNAGNRTVTFSPINLASGASQTYPFTVSINPGSYFAPVTHFTEPVAGAAIPAAWTATSINATAWTVATGIGHSLPNSFAALYNAAAANDLSLATTAQYNITPNSASNYTTLSFWHQYNSEEGWDGGVVEVSTNNGGTWSDLGSKFVKNGYNGSLGTGSNLAGRGAFTGTSGSFIESVINLSSYAGQNIKIRFRFASDNNTGAPTGTSGWWVDDITLYSEPAVQMRSNLFNASSVRQSYSDTITRITVGCTAATITAQPSNANGCIGGSTTISVTATGGTPTYQWQENTGSGFVDLVNNATYSGVNTATLTISGITAGMNGYLYRVIVANTCTPSFNSNNASLSVGAVATLNSSPGNVNTCPGTNASFVVSASNATNYQWQENSGSGFVNLSNNSTYGGVNTATLTITSVTAGMNNYQYRAVIGSCPSAINSNAATLTVPAAPSITAQPANVTVCDGQGATFSVTVSGTVGTYQWQVSNDGGTTYTNISGANATSFNIPATTTALNNTRYKVVITGTCGNVTSNAVVLTVNPLPVFTLGTAIPTFLCTSDLPVTLTASVTGGVWTGNGVSGTTFTPSASNVGNQTVTYTVTSLGCSSAQSTVIQVSECADRHLLLTNVGSVLISPNPNPGYFQLRVKTDLYKRLGVRVYDSHGKLVRAYVFNNIGYGSVIPMLLESAEDGVYHLYLYNDENGFISRGASFIIQN